jgi:MerR family transcriptional regulator/heat shock protein HspR
MKRSAAYRDGFDVRADEPVYPSGVVCRLLDIPIWVLKQLDKESIISPPRKKGKSRLYSKNELDKLHHVWFIMREKKIKVTGLKYVLEMEEKLYGRR